jgi:hypothetical protein
METRAPFKIEQWRKEADLTQAEAGAEFGVSRQAWINWVGRINRPHADTMAEFDRRGICAISDWYPQQKTADAAPERAAA